MPMKVNPQNKHNFGLCQAASFLLYAYTPAVSKPWFGQLMAGPQMMAYLIQVEYWMRGGLHISS